MTQYTLHSLWGRSSSTARYFHPRAHLRPLEYIGRGSRVFRERLDVEEEFLLQHLDEIKGHVASGLIEVRLRGGGTVDLATFAVAPVEPPAPPIQPPAAKVAGLVFQTHRRFFNDAPSPDEEVKELPELVKTEIERRPAPVEEPVDTVQTVDLAPVVSSDQPIASNAVPSTTQTKVEPRQDPKFGRNDRRHKRR